MASLKGGQSIWNAVSVGQNDVSGMAEIGPAPYVTVYVHNAGATQVTVDVEVSSPVNPAAGRNALSSAVDGGMTWCKYSSASGSTALVIAAGASLAFDLSPFGPPLVRLKRTDATGNCVVTAWVSSVGN